MTKIQEKLSPTHDNNKFRKLPYWGDTSKDFFATIGDSFTYGCGVEYEQSWSSVLAKKLSMEHINLAFPGSSIEYQSSKTELLLHLLPNVKFVVWMMTFPTRSQDPDANLSDVKRRMHDHSTWKDPKTLQKIVDNVDKFSKQKILITNIWYYPPPFLKIIKSKFRNTANFFVNDQKPVDLGNPSHVGPQSHLNVANKIYNYIETHFKNWKGNNEQSRSLQV